MELDGQSEGPAQLGGAAITWAAVSLADKIDTIVGLFAAGEKPTGSRDPYGLRRAAHGVLRVLIDLQALTGLDARPSVCELCARAALGFPGRESWDKWPFLALGVVMNIRMRRFVN